MFKFFETLVDPYCDYDEVDTPPTKLWPFMRDYARLCAAIPQSLCFCNDNVSHCGRC